MATGPGKLGKITGHTGNGIAVAPGRDISRLLFVVDPDALGYNIGKAKAKGALDGIEARGGEILSGAGDTVVKKVHQRLAGKQDRDGIVLLGGYDVVSPSAREVLDPVLRNDVGTKEVNEDGDRFCVWSDASYGDFNDDLIPEVPVSRIPDAGDAKLFLAALGAPALKFGERFGVRNVNRPFASTVWKTVIGTRELNKCEPFASSSVASPEIDSPCHYYMLHCTATDATQFTGGTETGGGEPVGFDVTKVPQHFQGLVFSGCCWGALIVNGKAYEARTVPPSRTSAESIALSYLKAGAIAFIGATGMHYSGQSEDPNENYALLLHQAFWSRLANHGLPALALFEAKLDFHTHLDSVRDQLTALEYARRRKNLAQLTCLGLGW